MTVASIITNWKNKEFKPVYWLEGEEEYFLDELVNYAEKNILTPAEAEFNQTVFYGRDVTWPDVINGCRKYPMFGEKQLVLLKEAQQMREIDKLEAYINSPLASTIFIVAYKGKALDGRTKFATLVKKKTEHFLSKKLYDNQLPDWLNAHLQQTGFRITTKALYLLIDHIGNDLSRMVNEVDKLSLNLGNEKTITEDHIEMFIGISKDYNVFELQNALSRKDAAAAIRIVQHFDANPKANPVQQLLPSLYSYFAKILPVYQLADKSEKALKPLFSFNISLVHQVQTTLKNYSYSDIQQVILLLQDTNLKSIGIGSTGSTVGSLMKELSYKIIHVNNG